MARRTFGDMRKVWDTKRLSDNVKLRMYEAMVISRLVYGHEAYVLDEKTKKALRNFNARCLHRTTVPACPGRSCLQTSCRQR